MNSTPERSTRNAQRGGLWKWAGGAFAAMTLLSSSAVADSEALTPADYDASRKYVETSYGKIAYVERGTGPVALFIHGALLNGYQWRYQLGTLGDVRRCIALDTMGMGHTEIKADQPLGMAEQAKMVAAFLDALKIDKVDLVGNDSGGGTAQIFAATNPDRIRSLTLTNCEVHTYHENNPMSAQLSTMVESGILGQTIKAG